MARASLEGYGASGFPLFCSRLQELHVHGKLHTMQDVWAYVSRLSIFGLEFKTDMSWDALFAFNNAFLKAPHSHTVT